MAPLVCQDQENLVHGHQTAAALKPLNQSTRTHALKTPGNKGSVATKIPLNSELKATNLKREGIGRDTENLNLPGKSNKLDKFAFVTPVAPRDRAPLVAKTTNAKAIAFQTPAPLTQRTQRHSTSTRRSKLKIHRPEIIEAKQIGTDIEQEEPAIEYCPPKITPLPDHPDEDDEWGLDKDFPMFEPQNKLRGWFSHFSNPVGEDGLSQWEREDNVESARIEKDMNDRLLAAVQRSLTRNTESDRDILDQQVCSGAVSKSDNINQETQPTMAPSSQINLARTSSSRLNSKSAAATLAGTPGPNFARPTVTSKAKEATYTATHFPAHQRVRTAGSNTTIGYARGRQTSFAMRRFPDLAAEVLTQGTGLDSMESDDEFLRALMSGASDDDHENIHFCDPEAIDKFFREEAEKDFVLDISPA